MISCRATGGYVTGYGSTPQEAYDRYVKHVRVFSDNPKKWQDCLFEETTAIKVIQKEIPVLSTTTVLMKDDNAPRS